MLTRPTASNGSAGVFGERAPTTCAWDITAGEVISLWRAINVYTGRRYSPWVPRDFPFSNQSVDLSKPIDYHNDRRYEPW